MDDEMFITHLLNSLPQAEYEGAILVIKERLRGSTCDLAQVEQLLEDKYLSMKYVKGWEEEKDGSALLAIPANKKGKKNQFKGRYGYCGEIGHKAANCPDKKGKKKEDSQDKFNKKRHKNTKKDSKLNVTIVEKWVILPGIVRNHAKTLILLEKVSKIENSAN